MSPTPPSQPLTSTATHSQGWGRLGGLLTVSLALHLLLFSLWPSAETARLPNAEGGLRVALITAPTQPERKPLHHTPPPRAVAAATKKLAASAKSRKRRVTLHPAAEPSPAPAEDKTSTTGPTSAASTQSSLALHARAIQQQLSHHFVYPLLARKRGWHGEVVLSFRLESDGRICDARIARSSGHGVLDRAALTALARVGPLANPPLQSITMELPVIYRLEG